MKRHCPPLSRPSSSIVYWHQKDQRRFSDLGRREEALSAIEQAVELRRSLASERPAIFNPELAVSLNNLSRCLSDMGRREDALAATNQAAQLLNIP